MGFKITKDYIKDEGTKGNVGVESIEPTNFLQMYIDQTDPTKYKYNGGSIKVRLKDDDKNVYYHGLVDDIDFSCELFLDWGMSDAGCTSLDLYKEDWDRLTGGKEHPYLSKDGKWYSYMG